MSGHTFGRVSSHPFVEGTTPLATSEIVTRSVSEVWGRWRSASLTLRVTMARFVGASEVQSCDSY